MCTDPAEESRRRGRALRGAALCALLVSFAVLSSCARPAAAPPKGEGYNLLLITIDTVRADHVGAWGSPTARTPNLDALAASGLRFDSAMSAVPLTLPSHATILSGVLPQHHGLRNNGGGALPDGTATLATRLSSAGYRTGAFVGSFVLDHRFGLNRGFDVYDDDIPRDPTGTAGLEAERSADQVVDRALAWLGKGDARPFFGWVHLYDAHAPYAPPEPYRSQFAGDPYDGEIAFVDAQIGRLLDALRKSGLRERTIVAVMADHGESLGEHGELTHGLFLYEPTLRVPLIVDAPGLLAPRVVRTPVSLADVAPTLAALANKPLDGKRDGRDLTAALLAGREPETAYLFAETQYPTIFGWSDLTAVRKGAMKFIAAPKPELYDLAADPHEATNVRETMRRALHELEPKVAEIRKGEVTAAAPASMDAETAAKLASLGYVGGAPAPATGSRPDPKDMAPLFRRFEEATWALNGRRTPEAVAAFESLTRDDPRNPVFRGSLARAYRQGGQLSRAIGVYREAAAMNPADPEVWYNLAVAFQEGGKVAESAQAVEEAIRRDPNRPEAHNALGIAYSSAGRVDDAMREFQRALAIDERNAHAWNNIGNVLRTVGRLDEAAEAYRKAIALSPSYADPLNGLGTLEVQRDRPKVALGYFDRALVLAPEYHEILLNKGIALQTLGDREGAAKEYRSFLDAVGQEPEFTEQRHAARQLLSRLEGGPISTSDGGR